MRSCIIIVVYAGCITFGKSLILMQALAVLIPIALHTLFGMAFLILVAVDSRAPINGANPMPLMIFDPLCFIARLLIP